MVPEPVTDPHLDPNVDSPGEFRRAGTASRRAITVRRVGPRQPTVAAGERSTSLAADNHFASALITLWHRVSQAGGAVGFDTSATVRRSLRQ